MIDWDPDDFRRAGHALVDLLADRLKTLPDGPVWQPVPDAERAALRTDALRDTPTGPDALLDEFTARVMPHPMGNGHPAFFGWVNSSPHPAGVLGEFAAAAMGPSTAGGDQSGVHLEYGVVGQLADLVGYPAGAGLLVSGGSTASLTALAAARHAAALADGWDDRTEGLSDRPRLVVYASGETHSCVRKSAELLGLGGVRVVPGEGRFDPAALRAAVAADRAAGLRPFAVAASAGTVNTGLVDPLTELADVCAEEGLWLHVDGAYGAFGRLDPELADAYAGLERADSLALDPHKWPGVPVGCGAVLVRDPEILRATFSAVAPYLRNEPGEGFGGGTWLAELGFEQSRPFRALPAWMTLRAMGRDGLTELVVRHRRQARELAASLSELPDFTVAAEPGLSVVCFRHEPAGIPPREVDELNRLLPARLQTLGTVFLTGTELDGRPVLRVCVLHRDTGPAHLARIPGAVREAAATLRRE
ncbi:pyridoxal phosphate-dependent decarboxylase family protein [Phytomonospora endophytica]|uniref:Glutamate/tyrosine decarboxylase-like PLP-dependent enzyme n=1 Tax=Phytomonospora endophytica TaxID=714109 RepID=A0A841FNW2_9ACTN|nr:pyridoxal-dependent decarboxylase [Phytomonospora endophytica]MBB6037514.1 glutamate/tyrosine decarboxylase-like PLP-dependent enzyme [Phytomonospora endophytica]GIG70766.1 amino acid decarboxylase [Phytomonospora endophytica]